jgi:hypothetical protein
MGAARRRLRLRESGLEWREVEGQVVVLDVRRSHYFSINRTGHTLWSALAVGTTWEELVDRLVEVHGAERERAVADAHAFVDALDARGLIAREN